MQPTNTPKAIVTILFGLSMATSLNARASDDYCAYVFDVSSSQYYSVPSELFSLYGYDSPLECGQQGIQQQVFNMATLNTAANISTIVGNMVSGNQGSGAQRFSLNQGSESGLAASAAAGAFNAWVAYAHSRVDYSFAPLESEGHSNVGLFGIDYALTGNSLLGVAVSIDRTDLDTDYNDGNIDNDGYSISPYLAWMFHRNWTLDASIGWGRSDYDQDGRTIFGRVTGSTVDHRRFSALGLSYNRDAGNWRFTGKGNLLYARDRFDSYTDSLGARVASSSNTLTQLRLGAQATYAMQNVAPYAGITYTTDLSREEQDAIAGQSAENDNNSFILQAGLNFYANGPLSGGVMLQTEVGRSETDNDQLLANISYNF